MLSISCPIVCGSSLCPAGLEDMVLSALVQEQVEGLTPEAISLMSPQKLSVSVSLVLMAINSGNVAGQYLGTLLLEWSNNVMMK